eukprot:47097-Eustigmatos_ZCMA.PRE.1
MQKGHHRVYPKDGRAASHTDHMAREAQRGRRWAMAEAHLPPRHHRQLIRPANGESAQCVRALVMICVLYVDAERQ